MYSTESFTVNGRTYFPPGKPVVVICLDGSADEYLDCSLAEDRMPNLKKMTKQGYRGRVRAALPSFTNVNNTSLVTGVPPSIHGICGNFFYDAAENREVMMNAATYLRAGTLLAAAASAGRKVAVVTAKEKLRDILSHGLEGIAFSAEKAALARKETHGIGEVENLAGCPAPPIYSAAASLFVLRAGISLLEHKLADFLYLSLTDYIQHTYAPDERESLEFYEAVDKELGRLLNLGAIVGITADHGMNAKQNPDGTPRVLYLETLLSEKFGPGFRVVCPITDPYVKHHGALGSYAVAYLPPAWQGLANRSRVAEVCEWLLEQPGITEVYDRSGAGRLLEQPADRTGDIVVLSGRNVALGRTPADHDLSALERGLRSHGGRYEEMVPLVISHPLNPVYRSRAMGDPRNFDVFEFTVNGTLIN